MYSPRWNQTPFSAVIRRTGRLSAVSSPLNPFFKSQRHLLLARWWWWVTFDEFESHIGSHCYACSHCLILTWWNVHGCWAGKLSQTSNDAARNVWDLDMAMRSWCDQQITLLMQPISPQVVGSHTHLCINIYMLLHIPQTVHDCSRTRWELKRGWDSDYILIWFTHTPAIMSKVKAWSWGITIDACLQGVPTTSPHQMWCMR